MNDSRILRIITRLNIGGPAIQAITLSSGLADSGFDTTLVHGRLGPGEGDMQALLPTSELARLFMPSLQRSIAPASDAITVWRLFRLMHRLKPAIIHTHMAKAGALGRLAAIAYNSSPGRNPRAKVVHTYHGHVFEGYFSRRKTAIFVLLERILARWTDVIIAISPALQHDLEVVHRIGRHGQYRTIPLGFDLAPFAAVDRQMRANARQELGIPDGTPVVATVGRLTAIKNFPLFLDMARLIADRLPATVFLIVGGGELQNELQDLAGRLNLDRNVRFLGWRTDLPRIYAASDVFVLTSKNEGTPVALIEAMASGIASVSTAVGGVGDVLAGSDTGVLVPPPGSGQVLADAVCSLLEAPERRAQMGNNARQAVLSRYGLDRLIKDIDRLYTDALLAEVK